MLLIAVLPTVRHARAGVFTLMDGNSILKIDTLSQATVFEWKVENVNHLKEMSNWYRVDGMTDEAGVHTLSLFSETQTGNILNVVYDDPLGRFTVETIFALSGGAWGSGYSKMGETIRVTNHTAAPLNFYLFEYVDLDLHESPGDDTVVLTSANSLLQFDSLTTFVGSFDVDRHELNTYPNTLNKFSDGSVSNLSHVWPGGIGPVGPQDVTFALQWNFVGPVPNPRFAIMPGATVVITKDSELQMTIVPEASSGMLAAIGGLALLLARARSMSSRKQAGPV